MLNCMAELGVVFVALVLLIIQGPILVGSQISINCRYADAQLFSRLQLHAASRWPCFLGPQLLGERPSRCQKSASLHLSKKLFHLVWWGLSLSPLMYHLFPDQYIDWQLSLSLSLPLQGLKIRLAFMPGFLYALFSEKWVRGDPLRCCLLRMLPCPLFAKACNFALAFGHANPFDYPQDLQNYKA